MLSKRNERIRNHMIALTIKYHCDLSDIPEFYTMDKKYTDELNKMLYEDSIT